MFVFILGLCLVIQCSHAFVRGPEREDGPYTTRPRACAPVQPPLEKRNFTYDSKLEDRQMWNWNAGYCGETSFVMASLKYGSYFSQYDVRDVAVIADVPHQSGGFWYDISINDQLTTSKMRMTSEEYWGDGKTRHGKVQADTYDYVAWIKEMMRKNYAVTMCVYMNHFLIYKDPDPSAGYHACDHYVTVTKYETDFDDDEYHDSDIVTIADHAVYPKNPTETPPCYFFYIVKDWMANREEANDPKGHIYSLPKRGLTIRNYGVAQTGIIDVKKECLAVSVATDKNYEQPQIMNKSDKRPTPMPLTLTVTVHGIEEGVDYVLYRYDDEKVVPEHSFNEHKANAKESIQFRGDATGTYQLIQNIMSNEKVIYRAVKA